MRGGVDVGRVGSGGAHGGGASCGVGMEHESGARRARTGGGALSDLERVIEADSGTEGGDARGTAAAVGRVPPATAAAGEAAAAAGGGVAGAGPVSSGTDFRPAPVSAVTLSRRRGKQRATSVNRSASQPAAASSGRPPLSTPTNSAPTARRRAASLGLSPVGMGRIGLSLDHGSSSQAAPADDSALSRLMSPGLFGEQARPTATPVAAPFCVAAADRGSLRAPRDAPAVGGTSQEARGGALLADAVERGHVPLRDDVATLTTSVKQLVEMVNNLRLGFEVFARGHKRVLTGVMLLRVDTANGFEESMTTLATGRSQVVERSGGGSAEVVVLTAIAERKRLVRVNLYDGAHGARGTLAGRVRGQQPQLAWNHPRGVGSTGRHRGRGGRLADGLHGGTLAQGRMKDETDSAVQAHPAGEAARHVRVEVARRVGVL